MNVSFAVNVSPRALLRVVGMLRVISDDVNQPSLPVPFILFLVFVSVSVALSTIFRSINSPCNSPLSYHVLPVLFLPYWSSQLYILLIKVSIIRQKYVV